MKVSNLDFIFETATGISASDGGWWAELVYIDPVWTAGE